MVGPPVLDSMGRGLLRKSVGLYRRTLRWTWTRREVQETTSREKVTYFVVLYGSWFVVMIGIALALGTAGFTDAASAIWIFGIGFSAFMASVDIAWETVTYLFERRDERSAPQDAIGPQRELARNLHPARDTWVGFVITVVALLVLFGIYQLSLVI